MDPANASVFSGNYDTVASIEAPDATTVVITLSEPNAAFNALIGSALILPSSYHAEVGQTAYAQAPSGTGAFKLNSFDPSSRTLLDAWDDHFQGRPNVDQLADRCRPEASVRAEALENGESDNNVWQLTPEDDERLQEDPDFTTITTLNFAVNHFPLNIQHPILSDVKVRQAMMYAIDRQLIIDEIFLGAAEPATSNLSPGNATFYNPDVTMYAYDPEKAGSLLDEAGWMMGDGDVRQKDGQDLTFTIAIPSGDSTRRSEAEVVQDFFKDVGIDAQLQETPVAQILDQLPAGEVDAALFNWTLWRWRGPGCVVDAGFHGAEQFLQLQERPRR